MSERLSAREVKQYVTERVGYTTYCSTLLGGVP